MSNLDHNLYGTSIYAITGMMANRTANGLGPYPCKIFR